MKQILQNLKSGSTDLIDTPAPRASSGHLLISTTASLISAGTERMLVDFGKAGFIQKARQQPDKVKMGSTMGVPPWGSSLESSSGHNTNFNVSDQIAALPVGAVFHKLASVLLCNVS